MRIGVLDLEMAGWVAGGVVSRIMAYSLHGAGADVVFLSGASQEFPFCVAPVSIPRYLPGEWTLRKITKIGERTAIPAAAKKAGVQVVLPMTLPFADPALRKIGWIPDFQHFHLPQNYTAAQKRELDKRFAQLVRESDRMLFSSEDVRNDFVAAFPQDAQKARVAGFSSLFAFEPPKGDPLSILKAYHIPSRFLLIINQFWRHKNHAIAVKALAILAQKGLRVPLVIAGLPSDYRDRQNDALSETFQIAARGNVSPQCIHLGKVSRDVIESLLQCATAFIQPSRFEGWNTSVQDAKALGCPLFVSDLAVHREQCPQAHGFFPPDDAETLAQQILQQWESLPTRPDATAEAKALQAERAHAKNYGDHLLRFCRELS